MLTFSLNSLIVFYNVAKMKSFSKAAELLFMTQPGVSNHIKQLEAQVGRKLLVRGRDGIELTKEGKAIFRYAEKIMDLSGKVQKFIWDMRKGENPVLKISATPVYSRVFVPSLIGTFVKEYPNVVVKVDLSNSEEMIGKLTRGEVDAAIVANPKKSKRIDIIPLLREELVLITDRAHPLSKFESVSLKDIAKYPLVMREEGSATRRVALEAFRSKGIEPSIVFEVKSTEFIKEWVAEGRGVSIVIKRVVSDEEKAKISLVRIEEPLYLEVSMVFLKANRTNHVLERFINHIQMLRSKSLLCS